MLPMGTELSNPFRPGAGHMPPYLAGRELEKTEFSRLLGQDVILDNCVLTGLRGVGKTVLLDTFRPMAVSAGWLWVGTDLSESASISEANLATRLLADLAVATSSLTLRVDDLRSVGFTSNQEEKSLSFEVLAHVYDATPGLAVDKIKGVLAIVHRALQDRSDIRGIIFAYDEAQNLADHAEEKQYPLSVLLDTFQSIQRMGYRFMLVLVGLPTLFPKLVEARTFSERMFHVVFLDRLDHEASRAAIEVPLKTIDQVDALSLESIEVVIDTSGGYPYFIQFMCREVYDVFVQQKRAGERMTVPIGEILRKLDTDFFAGRWNKATDRQRELLAVIARLENADSEFTVQEIVQESQSGPEKPFGSSHANQILAALAEHGLVYKNRHGKYSFAVPLMGRFISRQWAAAAG